MDHRMKKTLEILNPGNLLSSERIKPTIILILAALFPALHRSFGSMEFARRTFSSLTDFEVSLFMFATAFLIMGILPFVIIVFVFRDPLKEYGLRLGDWKRGLPAILILFVLVSGAIIFPASQTQDMRAAFPFDKAATESIFAFLRLQFFRGLMFYTAWEFFFRGFMLFGLKKYLGDWMAICIQTIPSCLWHIGMPTGELLSSLLAGLLFGILAIRTRSILWVFLLHYSIGIILDVFIALT